MAREVKRRRPSQTTTVSSKHQVTIPVDVFQAASLKPGDVLRVEATGVGTVTLTRMDTLVDRFSGALSAEPGEPTLRELIEETRTEWA
jgi:bifunctional DNA-binding transcriptional regulator/antitoxin component of YhaV-PrlF toxin-antitoxin module